MELATLGNVIDWTPAIRRVRFTGPRCGCRSEHGPGVPPRATTRHPVRARIGACGARLTRRASPDDARRCAPARTETVDPCESKSGPASGLRGGNAPRGHSAISGSLRSPSDTATMLPMGCWLRCCPSVHRCRSILAICCQLAAAGPPAHVPETQTRPFERPRLTRTVAFCANLTERTRAAGGGSPGWERKSTNSGNTTRGDHCVGMGRR